MNNKKFHIIFIFIMLILTVLHLNYWQIFNPNIMPDLSQTTFYYPNAELLRQSIFLYKDFWPLWNPYGFSGTNLFASAGFIGIDSFLGLLILVIPSSLWAVKFSFILDIFLAGLTMYIFMMYLTRKPNISFISSLVYMFSGYPVWALHDSLTQLNSYVMLPLIFLFAFKAFKEKWLLNSILAGIMLAIQSRMGPDLKIFIFTMVLFLIFLAFQLISYNFINRLKKTLAIGIVVGIVLFGLSAQRILPTKEYLDITARQHLTWQQTSNRNVPLAKTFSQAIEPIELPKVRSTDVRGGFKIGIIAFSLSLFAIYSRPKNKHVLFFLIAAIFAISITSASFVLHFLYSYIPPFDSFRFPERIFSIFTFAMAPLAGFGASSFLEKFNEKKKNLFYLLIIALILLNLLIFSHASYKSYGLMDIPELIEKNYILQHVSKQPGIFRYHTYEQTGIDWGTDYYNVPLKLEYMYSFKGTWLTEFMNIYLSIAYKDPAKFWGIMNVKYLTSEKELNLSNFRFINKFPDCNPCPNHKELYKAHGPYLYENEKFMPRAYIGNYSILVVGEQNDPQSPVMQTIYSIMLNENFDPATTVIIKGKKSINEYSINDLNKYNVIILTQGSIDQNSGIILNSYVSSGGMLIPDVTKNENSASAEKINSILTSATSFNPIDDKNIIMHNFDKKEIKNIPKGFLVMSEQYDLYPGWRATADGKKKEILRANGVISAIYLEEPVNSIIFQYKPKSYIIGRNISIITVILILIYFGYVFIEKRVVKPKPLSEIKRDSPE